MEELFLGIFTGKFENVSQMKTAVQKGGIIDGTSGLIDSILNKVQKEKILPKDVTTILKQGKNIVLQNVSKNIENSLTDQLKEIESIEKYSNNWEKYYKEQDVKGMQKEFKKIEKSLEKVIPLEDVLKRARQIENIQKLVENKNSFDLSEVEQELTKKLA